MIRLVPFIMFGLLASQCRMVGPNGQSPGPDPEPPPPATWLGVWHYAEHEEAWPGLEYTYTILLTNDQENAALTGLEVRVEVARELNLLVAPGACLTPTGPLWQIPRLPAGASVELNYGVRVRQGLRRLPRPVDNWLEITADQYHDPLTNKATAMILEAGAGI